VDRLGIGETAALLVGIPVLLTVLLLAEALLPLRATVVSSARRWGINAALYLINTLIGAALGPEQWALGAGPIAFMERVLGSMVAGAVGLLAIDLGFYGLHRLQHVSQFFWRLHKVHHSDLDVDVSTAVRHHPGEFLVNCLFLGSLTVLLGMPPQIIAIYGVIAIAVEMIQHANLGWPVWAERAVSVVFVTPGLHHRHHSCDADVFNTNFGTVFSVWDRLFGSFDGSSVVAQFGVSGIEWQRCRTLWGVLALPLAGSPRNDRTLGE
jgi:sterol desaturase/sphingolipid hydroxylase (fatty acid hydroxylase superfamily)